MKPTYEELVAMLRRICDANCEGPIKVGAAIYDANDLLYRIDHAKNSD